MNRCQCFKTNGQQCSRQTQQGSMFCWQHRNCNNSRKNQQISNSPATHGSKNRPSSFTEITNPQEQHIIARNVQFYENLIQSIPSTFILRQTTVQGPFATLPDFQIYLGKAQMTLNEGNYYQTLIHLVQLHQTLRKMERIQDQLDEQPGQDDFLPILNKYLPNYQQLNQ